MIAGAWLVYERPPSSFLPEENRGVRMQMVPPPEGAARARTLAAVEKAEDFMPNRQGDAVASAFSSLGFSFQGSGRHAGMMFVKLKDDDERPDRTAAMNANGAMMRMREGQVSPRGAGNGQFLGLRHAAPRRGRAGCGRAARSEVGALAQKDGRATQPCGAEDDRRPPPKPKFDAQKAQALGPSISEINSMPTTIFAGATANGFTLGTDLRDVIVMGEAPYRMQPTDIERWNAVNPDGDLAPFPAFMAQDRSESSEPLKRYDGTLALEISGAAGVGVSSGDAMEEIVPGLDGQRGVAWTGPVLSKASLRRSRSRCSARSPPSSCSSAAQPFMGAGPRTSRRCSRRRWRFRGRRRRPMSSASGTTSASRSAC